MSEIYRFLVDFLARSGFSLAYTLCRVVSHKPRDYMASDWARFGLSDDEGSALIQMADQIAGSLEVDPDVRGDASQDALLHALNLLKRQCNGNPPRTMPDSGPDRLQYLSMTMRNEMKKTIARRLYDTPMGHDGRPHADYQMTQLHDNQPNTPVGINQDQLTPPGSQVWPGTPYHKGVTQVKILAVFLALGLMAGVATAENYNLDIPARGRGGIPQDFYPNIEGTPRPVTVKYTVAKGDTADIDFDPDGCPGWFHLVIPAEATLVRGLIVFSEADDLASTATTQTYSWGDTVGFYIGEALFDEWFHVSGWDKVEARLVGSGNGLVDVYYWAELFTDSE